MFIKYQTVRNSVAGVATAIVGGVAAFFGLKGDGPTPTQQQVTAVSSHDTSHQRADIPPVRTSESTASTASTASTFAQVSAESDSGDFDVLSGDGHAQSASSLVEGSQTSRPQRASPTSKSQRYVAAMKAAHLAAPSSGRRKDALGAANPWKLNLYDDNKDGQWDRGKLDYDRDEVDDEKWNFKSGRWEKDGGNMVWAKDRWVDTKRDIPKERDDAPAENAKLLARYREAMKHAHRRATSSKGKDVLGRASDWKLNLYDDDGDGQWDRGKLDYDRDEVDDEKWNFKSGRWEKDGGNMVWAKDRWVDAKRGIPKKRDALPSNDTKLQARYREAMKYAHRRATSSKGKDVLGRASDWKLNLYDDDGDGQWDRGKLDYDRDEVDDEKWNFKNGRWEKDGGNSIWNGSDWSSD